MVAETLEALFKGGAGAGAGEAGDVISVPGEAGDAPNRGAEGGADREAAEAFKAPNMKGA